MCDACTRGKRDNDSVLMSRRVNESSCGRVIQSSGEERMSTRDNRQGDTHTVTGKNIYRRTTGSYTHASETGNH